MRWNLDKALATRILLLSGDESVFRTRALKEIQASLGEDEFDYQCLDADAGTPGEWIAAASTTPFLADRRTIIVRHLLRRDSSECTKDVLKAVPACGRLVLVADDESGDDSKQRRYESNRTAWEKLVAAAGGVVASFITDSKSFSALTREEAKRNGKTLSVGAAKLLEEMTGAKLGTAVGELDKLALFVGERAEIREDDVRRVVTPSRDWNVFKMLDAIVANRVDEALRQLRILVVSPTKAEDAAFRNMFPAMLKQLRMMWQARVCLEANLDPSRKNAIPEYWFPNKPNICTESDWQRNKAFSAARTVSLHQIQEAFEAMDRAECRLKGIIPAYTSLDTLESMITELAMALSKPARAA